MLYEVITAHGDAGEAVQLPPAPDGRRVQHRLQRPDGHAAFLPVPAGPALGPDRAQTVDHRGPDRDRPGHGTHGGGEHDGTAHGPAAVSGTGLRCSYNFV